MKSILTLFLALMRLMVYSQPFSCNTSTNEMDGTVYHTVQTANQYLMKENMNPARHANDQAVGIRKANTLSNIVHIRLPERVRLESQTKNFTVQTTFHQWTKDLDLEVFDLFGRPVFRKTIKPDERELMLDVSAWPRGMYVVRLVYNSRVAASERLVINYQ